MMEDSPTGSSSSTDALPEDLRALKRALRRRVLAARDALPADERRRRSAAITSRAAALPELSEAATIMVFASFGTEVDTEPLIRQCLDLGSAVCLPRVLGPRLMVACRITHPERDLAPGAWGIREPRDGLDVVDPATIDAVVVPGSVFDTHGRRYGYGGGFYDSYLSQMRPGVPRIGLAFDLQVVELLRTEAHDLPIDALVTETRVLRFG